MTYEYFCPNCEVIVEVESPMDADHSPGPCPDCGKTMGRIYGANFICDEIRSTWHFNPKTRQEEKTWGQHFDVGLGRWIGTKSERRRIMKEKGLAELGTEKLGDSTYEKVFKRKRLEGLTRGQSL